MKNMILNLFVLTLVWSTMAEEPPYMKKMYMTFRDFFFNLIEDDSLKVLKRAAQLNKLQLQIDENFPFPCKLNNTRSSFPPESVHQLRPGDIDVIGAFGDSLTAANGAAAINFAQISIEYRGLSWSIGGQGNWRQYLTLPNILKEFNPNLIGYSLGNSLSHHSNAQFNVAELGSMSEDLHYMIRELVRRIKSDKRVNVEKHWKLINVMIGANDFCVKFCYLKPKTFENAAEIHRRELTEALDYIRDNLPRTLVNLILVPHLKLLQNLKGLPGFCEYSHLLMCPCLFGFAHKSKVKANFAKQEEWRQVQKEVANDSRYRKKPDFAVVLQPFADKLIFPRIKTKNGIINDSTFLSEDCFHLSQKGCAMAANALWNNMLQPVGKKSKNWNKTYSTFLCPTEKHPYIYTHENSFYE